MVSSCAVTDVDTFIDTMIGLDSLADLPRTGWLLRGVRPCESIADHSFGVVLCAMLLTDALRAEGAEVDGERVLRMAILHDAPEAKTGDLPMPIKTPEIEQALNELDARIARTLLPEPLYEIWNEAERGETLEAKIVKASDKLQMMIKAHVYEHQGRGRLDEFWDNPKNFRDMGLPVAKLIYARLRELRARGPDSS